MKNVHLFGAMTTKSISSNENVLLSIDSIGSYLNPSLAISLFPTVSSFTAWIIFECPLDINWDILGIQVSSAVPQAVYFACFMSDFDGHTISYFKSLGAVFSSSDLQQATVAGLGRRTSRRYFFLLWQKFKGQKMSISGVFFCNLIALQIYSM